MNNIPEKAYFFTKNSNFSYANKRSKEKNSLLSSDLIVRRLSKSEKADNASGSSCGDVATPATESFCEPLLLPDMAAFDDF